MLCRLKPVKSANQMSPSAERIKYILLTSQRSCAGSIVTVTTASPIGQDSGEQITNESVAEAGDDGRLGTLRVYLSAHSPGS